MPLHRGSLSVLGNLGVAGASNLLGSSNQIGFSSSDHLTIAATEDAVGPRGVIYHESQRAHDIAPLNATYTQPGNPLYDVYYIGDTNDGSTTFKAGVGPNLVDHMYLVVNFSANIVHMLSSAGDPLGSLPAHSTAICINGTPIMIAGNALS